MTTMRTNASGGATGSDEPEADFAVTSPAEAVVTLTAHGHLGRSVACQLTTATEAAMRCAGHGADGVVVDLTAVTYLVLEPLTVLAGFARDCLQAGFWLRIRPSPAARTKILLTGLAEVLPLQP